MAHGDHWSCVLTDDDADVTEFLSLATAKGNAVAGTAHCLEIKSAAEWKSLGVNPSSAPIAIVYDAGPYSILVLMLYVKKKKYVFLNDDYYSIWSSYPFISNGKIFYFEIKDISEWGNGVEASVTGSIENDLTISFFDCFYFKNSEKYEIGKRIAVELGSLAFGIKKWKETDYLFEEPEDIQKLSRATGMPIPLGKIEVNIENFCVLMPVDEKEWDNYEYRFSGIVNSIDTMEAHGNEYHQMLVTVHSYHNLEIPILVANHVIDGDMPGVGDAITGALWIHGRLVDDE